MLHIHGAANNEENLVLVMTWACIAPWGGKSKKLYRNSKTKENNFEFPFSVCCGKINILGRKTNEQYAFFL